MVKKGMTREELVQALSLLPTLEIEEISDEAASESLRPISGSIKEHLAEAFEYMYTIDYSGILTEHREAIDSSIKSINDWAGVRVGGIEAGTAGNSSKAPKPPLTDDEVAKLNKYITGNCTSKAKAMTKDGLLKANGIEGLRSKESWDGVLAGCDTDGKKGRGAGYFRNK